MSGARSHRRAGALEGCTRRLPGRTSARRHAPVPPVGVEPNVMATTVGCTGCHDWSRKHSRQGVAEKCVGCHDKAYTSFLGEWTTGLDGGAAQVAQALKRAQAAVARERRAGRDTIEAEALVRQARAALALVQSARGIHNPPAAEALLTAARQKAEAAIARSAPR